MLGERLKKLRADKKITQQELADLFDVTTDYLLGCTDDPTKELPEEARKSLEESPPILYERHVLKFDYALFEGLGGQNDCLSRARKYFTKREECI